MSANRPDLHTPDHDQWDQGGYCNNLVLDDDGTATVCGYRRAHDMTDHSAVRWTCLEEGCGKSGIATDTLDRLLHDCKSRGPLDTVSILLIEDTEGHRMTTYKTPEDIADATIDTVTTLTPKGARQLIIQAIEADRAQRQPEIYIVQNEAGDVVDVFRDADEATAAYQEGYSVIEETIWEPGEYASVRIGELTDAWEAATGDTASDYALSEDDWKVGLGDDEAAEIARLIEWREAQK